MRPDIRAWFSGMRIAWWQRLPAVWRYCHRSSCTAERLCTSDTEHRATGACIHFNTADQQAAVVCGIFTRIKRRIVFFPLCNSAGLLEQQEAVRKELSSKDKLKPKDHGWERQVHFQICTSVFFFFSFAIWFSVEACEMQPLPDRCVATELQPTGLYRHNVVVRVIPATKIRF